MKRFDTNLSEEQIKKGWLITHGTKKPFYSGEFKLQAQR